MGSRRGARALPALLIAAAVPAFSAQDYKDTLPADHAAIRYRDRAVSDRVQALVRELAKEPKALGEPRGLREYLPAVLEALDIAADSQMLVFSKTSLQAAHISPERPRALYFTDDVVAAYVPGAPAMELAAVDPHIGPVFYALSVDERGTPAFARSTACLTCHHGPNTAGVPGIYVGSVIPGPTGAPLRGDSAIITDHTTPFADRWGGWYVTAARGQPVDRANAVASNPAEPHELVRDSPRNLATLAGRLTVADYLAPTSDIVALMVFEHQTQMTNLLTRVSWEARLGGRVASLDDLVAYMFFSGEARLAEPVQGGSTFSRTFPQRGPRDRRGRSLRDFDLQTRLFRYPLSYLVYSAAFESLPQQVRAELYRRLYAVLTGADRSERYAHIAADDRQAILEILLETKPSLPPEWRRPSGGPGRPIASLSNVMLELSPGPPPNKTTKKR